MRRALRAAFALPALLCAVVATGGARAGTVDAVPEYRPQQQVSGTVRLWGHGSYKKDFMGRLVRAWSEGFRRYEPGVRIENDMYGTASAIGALYTGAGNLAILGEEISPAAQRAFERARGHAPLEIEVATGSVDVPFYDYAHMVFVNAANPLAHLSLRQLDAVFGAEHRRGPRNIRTWGELGLRGAWARRQIQPYGWKDLDFSLFIQSAVLGGSHRWNDDLAEFGHARKPDGSNVDPGQRILDALARDPYGIAISNSHYANPKVKAIAIGASDAGPYYAATRANLIAQRYPLTRVVPAFVDRVPGRPVEPAVREFLRYILSREGQQAIVNASGYLPLSTAAARAQLAKLGAAPVARGAGATGRCPPHRAKTVRVWSNAAMRGLVDRWRDDFRTTGGHASIVTSAPGSDVAMAGLYTRCADLALMGRAPTPSEIQAFEWIFRYKPSVVPLVTGSRNVAEKSPALVVLVSRANPLSRLTLPQLRAIFAYLGPAGGGSIATWGQLGLGGGWRMRAIDLYAPDMTSGTGVFFRHAVLQDSRRLEWARLRELSDDGSVARALARDRFGIAVAGVGIDRRDLKPLALAASAAAPFLAPNAAGIASRRYPLTRTAYTVFARAPDGAVDPAVAVFLTYLQSDRALAQIAPNAGYSALPAAAAAGRGAPCTAVRRACSTHVPS